MKFKLFNYSLLLSGLVLFAATSCKKEGCTDANASNYSEKAKEDDGSCTYDAGSLPTGYEKFYNITDIYVDGGNVIIKTTDEPDHVSPFYPTGHALYAPYDGTNTNFSTEISLMGQAQDPDIQAQNITFTIPVNAAENSSHEATGGGPIGVAINGVVFYSQYNGAQQLLDDLEFDNTDQYSGHPSPTNGQYHYHIEPAWLTSQNGDDALIGVLLDGFFVYGPKCNGVTITNSDLDAYHGHNSATSDFPDGVYHYHCTDDAPWINGDGYWGTPGTVN